MQSRTALTAISQVSRYILSVMGQVIDVCVPRSEVIEQRSEGRRSLAVEVDVENTSTRAGDEVVELYLGFPKLAGAPGRALRGFTRVHLDAGESRHVRLLLQPRDLSYVNEAGDRLISAGDCSVTVGGAHPGRTAAQVES